MVYTGPPKQVSKDKASVETNTPLHTKISAYNADKVASGQIPLSRKVDGRTSFVRAMKTYYQGIMVDLGATIDDDLGLVNREDLSILEVGITKQCAALLAVMDEMLMNKANGAYVEGEAWDLKTFTEVQKAYAHLARQIGLEKRPRLVHDNKDLGSIITQIKQTAN